MACDTIKIETLDADEVVSIVTQGPQGPSGAEAATLTTTGDLLYRAALANDRLPIGSEGQVLKVASGLPAWGNESGAVTSVNGETGAVVLDAADVGAAPASGIDPTAITGTAVVDSDVRLSDSRTPSSHASSHASAGSDPLAPSDIGAQSLFDAVNVTEGIETSPHQLSALRAQRVRVATTNDFTIRLPESGHQSGDIVEIFAATLSATKTITIERGVGSTAWATLATITTQNAKIRILANGTGRSNWQEDSYFTTNGTLGAPAVHVHGNLTNDGKIGSTAGLPLKTGTGGIVETGVFGTGAGEFAEGNHTHADLHTRSHAITSTSDHTAGNHKVFYSDGSGQIQELALGNSGEVLTSNGASAAPSFAAASGGIGGSTGSTDNAILRADGTGGSTSQSSDLVIDDATTSTQANVALVNNHSETNSALVLSPKGTGAFIIGPKPDGTSTGGNARGLKAVDLSHQRSAATQVASGNYSMVLGGDRCTSSSTATIAGGEVAAASGGYAIALGRFATASGTAGVVVGGQSNTTSGAEAGVFSGDTNTASGNNSCVLAGNYGVADRAGLIAQGNGRFAANGDSQWIHMVLRAKTTTNSAVELLINNLRTTNGRLTCPSGKIISGIINIHGVKSDGTASAHYVRQFQVKNVGGTSSYPYTAATVGTDYASSTSITFNDPDTNGDALSVSVTGIASETWRWTAHVSAVETTYGS